MANQETMPAGQEKAKSEREIAIEQISKMIEDARKKGLINNDAANLASVSLSLEGDEALLANRLVARGSDPASLELIVNGSISEPVMRAHRMGPGSLKTDEERQEWLELAAASLDEHGAEAISIADKFKQFMGGVNWLKNASQQDKDVAIQIELKKILDLPFMEETVRGVPIKVYSSDRGFASAYWSGNEYAAVRDNGGLLFIGSQGRSLAEIGIKVDKQLSPTFGIIFEKK